MRTIIEIDIREIDGSAVNTVANGPKAILQIEDHRTAEGLIVMKIGKGDKEASIAVSRMDIVNAVRRFAP